MPQIEKQKTNGTKRGFSQALFHIGASCGNRSNKAYGYVLAG